MTLANRLSRVPHTQLVQTPMPLEAMPRLVACTGCDLWVKRDDCTGLAMGGNKVRQLEYYLGEAVEQACDTVLITSAVQSNFVRLATAAANRLGMTCHIQLGDRVPFDDVFYRTNGNVLLDKVLGATLHSYPEGEDEAGADRSLKNLADDLSRKGARP
tara:strand:+ start:3167 stop:3640 length:474 start_codon:yes stop_codon:yes gene_type:complete